MNSNKKGQVELLRLIFTVSWEDPLSDYRALNIKPGERVFSITSGGCNTLGFLLKDPKVIHAVDINPSQSYLLKLKIAAIRSLKHEEFLQFTGILKSSDRQILYRKLREDLDSEAAEFWDYNSGMINQGFLFRGKYDQFVKVIGRLITFIQGSNRVDGLVKPKSLPEQRQFYKDEWETWRTKLIFNLFYNKMILGKIGLKTDYFHFDDGSNSYSESFRNKFRRACSDICVEGNYFLHFYLKGKYRSLTEMPEYLLKDNYELIKKRLDRIIITTKDAKKWLSEQQDESIDCICLSNICELMSPEDTRETFRQVYNKASKGARICFRNLIIPRAVPEDMQHLIVKDTVLSNELLAADRSFVYSKVDAMKVIK